MNEKYKLFDNNNQSKKGNSTILVINSVTQSDLGDYECTVKNQLGGSTAKIVLTYVPEPPHLTKSFQNGNEITTHWNIRSLISLEEIQINYKEHNVRYNISILFYVSIITEKWFVN